MFAQTWILNMVMQPLQDMQWHHILNLFANYIELLNTTACPPAQLRLDSILSAAGACQHAVESCVTTAPCCSVTDLLDLLDLLITAANHVVC